MTGALGHASLNSSRAHRRLRAREDAERFIEEIRRDEPELAEPLRVEERELEAGGLN